MNDFRLAQSTYSPEATTLAANVMAVVVNKHGTKQSLLVSLSLLLVALTAPLRCASISPYRPNILFVVIDDLGSHDLGIHGTSIISPTCDDLARSGVYLSDYYVLPSCSPTRSAIMSGRYPLHTGINNYIPPKSTAGLPLDEETIPEVLAKAGYRRHAVGKWHLGHSNWKQTPTFRGFESFYGFYLGGEDHFTHNAALGGYDMRSDSSEFCGAGCSKIVDERSNYSTHIFSREAVNVVRAHDPSAGLPLFLYLAYQAVHSPAEVPEEYVSPYQSKNWTTRRKIYGGMVTAVDEGIKNVTDALKEKGLYNDTLIIFTTDNGGPTETCGVQGSSNFPLRGGKCSIWQGGTTGDGFLSGPALSKLGIHTATGRRAGDKHLKSSLSAIMPHIFHCVDWLPTLAEMVGVEPNGKPLDGVSQLNALMGHGAAREEAYIGITDDQIGIHGPALRYQRWKFIEGTGGAPGGWPPVHWSGVDVNFDGIESERRALRVPVEGDNTSGYLLFDVWSDPREKKDLSSMHPDVVDMLRTKLETYKATGVPQQESDPSCPFRGLKNTSMGPTWMPWCSHAKRVVVYT